MLDSLKEHYGDLERDDFLWHYLLQSFATMGNISGWKGLIQNDANYRQITYDTLAKVPAASRLKHTLEICTNAKIRYPQKKAKYIIGCFEKIHNIGGQKAAKKALFEQLGCEGKINFLKKFPGIGDKYARNTMMDVYHDEFRESIAIDSRIEAISKEWKLSFKSYNAHEQFYLDVACDACLEGWELDRLMFRFQAVFYPPITISE